MGRDEPMVDSSAPMRAALLATVLLVCPACSRSDSAAADAAGGVDAPPSDGGYAVSPCGACVASGCGVALAACTADPDCSSYLACLDACPLADAGDVDPACERSCPRGTSSAGAVAIEQLTRCRTDGVGSLCPACGTDASAELNPALRNQCAPSTTGVACTDCKAEHCCQSAAACGAACKGFIGCISEGGAYTNCDSQFPGGRVPAESDEVCFEVFCCNPAACTVCASTRSQCDYCIYQQCPGEYANYRATQYGSLYAECATETMDAGGCIALYPQAQDVLTAYLTCVHDNCIICAQ